ncbi:MAG: hypothetical protein V4760_03275 [Bdellovibrionota bacterium]
MKRTLLFTTLVISAIALVGCGTVQRSHDSGYSFRDEEPAAKGRRSMDKDYAAQELGFTSRELSDKEARAVGDRAALTRAEKALEGKRERDQYFKNKAYFRSDRERVDFLQLDSFEARGRYLNNRGIDGNHTENPPEIQALIDVNDITLGMSKEAVKSSWGEPEAVEVAGDPIYGNERWHYSEQLPSTEGYLTENRLVYFEGGRVAGWEKR